MATTALLLLHFVAEFLPSKVLLIMFLEVLLVAKVSQKRRIRTMGAINNWQKLWDVAGWFWKSRKILQLWKSGTSVPNVAYFLPSTFHALARSDTNRTVVLIHRFGSCESHTLKKWLRLHDTFTQNSGTEGCFFEVDTKNRPSLVSFWKILLRVCYYLSRTCWKRHKFLFSTLREFEF